MDIRMLSAGGSDVGFPSGDSWGGGDSWWGNLGQAVGGLIGGYTNSRRYDVALPSGTGTDLPGIDTSMQGAFSPGTRGIVVVPTADGRLTFWRSAGRPMLWSGDLAAVKRVKRAASKAGRGFGRRGGR